MLSGFGRNKKLARYKRFSYEPRVFDAESESFKIRRDIIKEQIDNNQKIMSLEKEAFLLSKTKTNYTNIVFFIVFIVSAYWFYQFYNLNKVTKGEIISLLGSTWGSNEIGQYAALCSFLVCGYLFIKKSRRL